MRYTIKKIRRIYSEGDVDKQETFLLVTGAGYAFVEDLEDATMFRTATSAICAAANIPLEASNYDESLHSVVVYFEACEEGKLK